MSFEPTGILPDAMPSNTARLERESIQSIVSKIAAVDALWHEKKTLTGAIPKRSNFGMRDLKAVLQNVAFVAVDGAFDDDRNLRINMAGDALSEEFGTLIGKTFTTAFNANVFERFRDCFADVTAAKHPIIYSGPLSLIGKSHKHHLTLAAPLQNHDEVISNFLVVQYIFAAISDPITAPFEIKFLA